MLLYLALAKENIFHSDSLKSLFITQRFISTEYERMLLTKTILCGVQQSQMDSVLSILCSLSIFFHFMFILFILISHNRLCSFYLILCFAAPVSGRFAAFVFSWFVYKWLCVDLDSNVSDCFYRALLYESSRRKPGWRFTAGSKYGSCP